MQDRQYHLCPLKFRSPTHCKWNHCKQESHAIVSASASTWHLPQNQVAFFRSARITLRTTIQASSVKRHCTAWRQTFSSKQLAGTFSGLASSSFSSINFPVIAFSATLSSTNQPNITTRESDATNNSYGLGQLFTSVPFTFFFSQKRKRFSRGRFCSLTREPDNCFVVTFGTATTPNFWR